jgi:hypothetical protein
MGITVLSAVIKHGWLEIPELNGGFNGEKHRKVWKTPL